jgi:hypothetical protein
LIFPSATINTATFTSPETFAFLASLEYFGFSFFTPASSGASDAISTTSPPLIQLPLPSRGTGPFPNASVIVMVVCTSVVCPVSR